MRLVVNKIAIEEFNVLDHRKDNNIPYKLAAGGTYELASLSAL